MAKLDKYVVCKECHGSGLKKEIYNHMVMEKNCMGAYVGGGK